MDSNVDLVVKAVLDANRKPITTKEIAEASGLTVAQVGGAINRVVNANRYKIQRIVRGVFCYDPPEGLDLHQNKIDAVKDILLEKGEITHDEIVEITKGQKYEVYNLVAKARLKHKIKVKRHVVYRLEK